MAERRMFAKTIVLSDAFLDMPMSARCLYFTLGMLADDDGFVNSPKSIMRQCGATTDDANILIAKKFILCFETGVFVVKHWRIHNYIRKDTYAETKYQEEKAQLFLDENNAYTLHPEAKEQVSVNEPSTERLRIVYEPSTQDRIGKDSIGNNNSITPSPAKTTRFSKPTIQEIAEYCKERNNGIDAEYFFNYYEARNWIPSGSRTQMKSWKAAIITWEKNNKKKLPQTRICNNAASMQANETGGFDL